MNGRMYDANLGRFLSPDNFIQDPYNTQSFNRYGYVWNNPLSYNDPSGEVVILAAIAIAFVVGAAIDYGIQVVSNYASGYNGADAWFNKVDFFDVFVSGAISGLTAGAGSALNTGKHVGKAGLFLLENKSLIKAGEIVLTSAIDITGEGFQPISGKQFGQRVATAAVVWGATEVLKKAPKVEGVEGPIDNATLKTEQFDPIGEALAIDQSKTVEGIDTAAKGSTTVGRWMSKGELAAMRNGSSVLEGAGGQTFVTKGGSHLFSSAPKGSVYVEFGVPTNSLLQGGKSGWLKMIGPNASKSQQYLLQKQGGSLLPPYQNMSPILKVK